MSGALTSLVGIMVATVVPMETLLFVAGDEQQNDTDCAQAVVESIAAEFWHHPVAAPRDSEEDDFSLSVAEINELLTVNQIPSRAFWMTWEEVAAVTATYGPVIVHFDEPAGHYAVTVGAVGDAPGDVHHLLIADPARGDIIVSKAWWRRHASGATVVVDTDWDRGTRDKHVEAARTRLRRLEVARDER